jgi:hypothetical protein
MRWQRVRGVEPVFHFSLERALICLRKILIHSNLRITLFTVETQRGQSTIPDRMRVYALISRWRFSGPRFRSDCWVTFPE